MDGNRRWAKSHFLPRLEGHRRGVKTVRNTVKACIEFGIPTLTLYTFSSENWGRPDDEVSALMGLLARSLRGEMDDLIKEGVRFRALGRLANLPTNIQELVVEMEKRTAENTRLNLNIALNYGGRQELVDAFGKLLIAVQNGSQSADGITEETIADHLTTAGQVDPDLLIRTGGEQRISNFLLWQVAYTELVFLKVFWPDFTRGHLLEAIQEYGRRERRFGTAK